MIEEIEHAPPTRLVLGMREDERTRGRGNGTVSTSPTVASGPSLRCQGQSKKEIAEAIVLGDELRRGKQ